jgi:glycosyltransferase involved in cell wall biosynthesis/peptidoglycan/xylan/chitin deacetylase (PgdA/CDA1 family)
MRLLFLTNIYPTPVDPAKGIFNHRLTTALSRHHEVRVVAPVSWVEEWERRRQGLLPFHLGRASRMDGIEVSHPRYYYPPKVLRNLYGWFYWHSVRSTVLPILKDEKPDAVISHWAHPDGEAALLAARLAGVPGVIIVGGSEVLQLTKKYGRRRCILRTLQAADAVVPVSDDLKFRLIELGITPDKMHVVERGVDTATFAPGNQSEARRRLGIDTAGKVLVWVGRMVPVKGLDVLLQACARLHDFVPFRLYLVGKGPLERELKDFCRSLDLADKVFFPGPCSHKELSDWYKAADLTVLPSRSEGIPNVLRESLACGTPFVASNVGGIPEIARHGPNRLVPPEDAGALTAALAAALVEPARPPVPPSILPTWEDSADALIRVVQSVRPARANSHLGLSSATTPAAMETPRGTPASSWTWRQLLRRAMSAALPRRLFLTRGPAAGASIALTFDDGPHPEHTARLLDILREHRASATFFVIGEQAKRYPNLVRRMAAEGHVVANHSYYNHPGAPESRSFKEWTDDIRRTSDLLADILGNPIRLFRPPHGKLTARGVWWLWRSGYTIALWNVDPKDYACASADEVRSWFAGHPFFAGDLVLMHDNHPHAAMVVPDLVAAVRRCQFSLTSLADWILPYAARMAASRADQAFWNPAR